MYATYILNGRYTVIYGKEQDNNAVTENSGSNAWNVNLSNGNLNYNNTKASNQNRVRPVSATNINSLKKDGGRKGYRGSVLSLR
jgi:hypothetical protein